MAAKLPFRLGVTLYSFNIEFYTYKRTFEDLIEKVTSLGPDQGIEVVAPQMDRGYPSLSPEFEHRFKNAREKYGFIPVCYSGYNDPQRYPGRYATREEDLDYIKLQIDAAATLGFPNTRLMFDEDLLDDLIPYAEKRKVCYGVEIHAPYMIENQERLIKKIREFDSEYFGIIPDCGAFCRNPSEVYYKRFAEQGVPKNIADEITRLWNTRESWVDKKDKLEMAEAVKAMGGDELAELMALESYNYFGHSDPKAMIPVMKYIHHMHGKFFYVNDLGEESAVRVPEIVDALARGGFTGSISCEYEGHHWFSDKDALDQIKRYQTLIHKSYDGMHK